MLGLFGSGQNLPLIERAALSKYTEVIKSNLTLFFITLKQGGLFSGDTEGEVWR